DTSKQGRINGIDADEEITLVSVQDDADKEMFEVDALNGEEVFVEGQNENVVEEVVDAAQVSESTTTKSITISSQQSQDKGKGIIIEEPMKPMKKKDLLKLDEEVALKLQAKFDEEERLAREKDEANVALTEEWDDIQAKIEADHELAQRLQAKEQEELSVEEKEKLFQQLLEKRRNHFAAKSAEEKRDKPPTQAQQRKIMCTYLKNMEGKKLKDLKNKSFNYIQKMFDKAFKRVNTFVDFRADLVEGSSKRVGEELEQESTKKQKVDEDKDTTELQSLMEVIPDEEEVTIDVVSLATKSPSIVDWKIHKEGKKSYYQIVRADRKFYQGRFGRSVQAVTTALIDVNAAQSKLVLLENFNENYSKCLRLLYKVNAAEGVNAASEEVSTAELVSTAYVIYMDQDSAHMVAASKVPMLKPGEFELWRMRIEQYIQMIDYALDQQLQMRFRLREEQKRILSFFNKMPTQFFYQTPLAKAETSF
ncbi:hypothetical protein Tco_1007588, partial [Tanacetum coccineum]